MKFPNLKSTFRQLIKAFQITLNSFLRYAYSYQTMKIMSWGVLLLILSSCQSIPKDFVAPASYAYTDTDKTLWGGFLSKTIKNNPGKSGFVPLQEGPDAYLARLMSIRKAEKSIDAQYYIWHDDLVGKMLMHEILKAADRGVRVRLLMDDLNIGQYQEELLVLDSHPMIEVRMFNPFAHRYTRLLDVFRFGQLNRRMHNKALIADNQVAIIGGRNIGNEYFTASEEQNFGDFDVWCFGPVVQESSRSFDLYWNNRLSVPITVLNKRVVAENDLVNMRNSLKEASKELHESVYAKDLQDSNLETQIHSQRLQTFWGKAKVFADSPDKISDDSAANRNPLLSQMTALPMKSEKEIFIVSPYFIPGKKGVEYFAKKVKAGIKVTVFTNSLASNDVSLVFSGYKKYRKDLLKAGVELYEMKPLVSAQLRKKSQVIGSSGARLGLHGKVYIFDRRVMFVGSMNLDPRSVELNSELGILFESPELASKYVGEMIDELPEIAYRVTMTDKGKLHWTTEDDEGNVVTLDKEPETSFWKSFKSAFLYIFVPESMM